MLAGGDRFGGLADLLAVAVHGLTGGDRGQSNLATTRYWLDCLKLDAVRLDEVADVDVGRKYGDVVARVHAYCSHCHVFTLVGGLLWVNRR